MLIKTKNTKKTTFPIIAFTVFLVFFILLTDSVNVYAANPTPFPYYCINDTYNTSINPYLDGIVESVKDKWYENGDDPFVIVMGEVFWNDDSSDPYWCMEGYVFWEVEFDDVLGESFASRTYQFRSNSSGNAHRFDIWLDSYRIYSYDNRVSGDFSMLGNQTIHQTSIGTYTYGYPIYCSEAISTWFPNSENVTVIANSSAQDPNDNLLGYLSTLPPIEDILNGISGSYNSGTTNTQPSWTTPPSYDSSISLAENIQNSIEWLADNLKDQFSWGFGVVKDTIDNLGTQINGMFNNLINNLKDFLNKVIQNIHNGFQTLINNINQVLAPLIQDIKNKIDQALDLIRKPMHFIEYLADFFTDEDGNFNLSYGLYKLFVPDVDDVQDALDGTSLGQFILGFNTFVTGTVNFIKSWFNITPSKVFHIPTFTFGGKTFTGLTIDFSWYDSYKSYGDAIISLFLLINYAFFLFRFAPRFFRSAGSGYDDFANLDIDQGVDHRIPY